VKKKRSSSTPPWFAQNCQDGSQSRDQEKRSAQSSPLTQERTPRGGYPKRGATFTAGASPSPGQSKEGRPPRQAAKNGGDNHGERSVAPLTPQLRNTDVDCDVNLPADEDFVEGGVELSPSCDALDRMLPDDGSLRPSTPTRPLLQLEERFLEEFWPSGDGPKALFLDYDGTLREFEARPELAVPTEEIRELLSAIDARVDFAPHIISGRNASFLEAHFAQYPRFTLVAEHGFQIWRPETQSWALWDGTTNHELWKSAIRGAMVEAVSEMPGSHLEEKASSLVWHYREVTNQTKAEEKAPLVIAKLARLVEEGSLTDVRISRGHKIVEASYQKVRKGPVMRKLCEDKALFGEPFVGVLTAGDDVSDESMFDSAPSDCLTIKVGPAETSARFRVETPAELREFLRKLLARGPPPGKASE